MERLTLDEVLEAFGTENKYFTYLAVGHEPTSSEILMHYLSHRRIPPNILRFDVERTENDETLPLFV